MTDSPLIQVRGLRFRYQGTDTDVLRIPALDVAGRGMTAITGPSGAGKSTLVELLAGTLRGPYDGSLLVLGQEWKSLTSDARRQRQIRRIGLIPQDYGLLTDRTPAQTLDQDLSDAGVDREVRGERIRSALEAVGLLDCYNRQIGTMSGGQRQRVAIARMLARDVELVIADEPTANLDPQLTAATMDTFRTLAARVPVIIITHDPAVAAACDRTILLQGTVQEILPSASPVAPSPRRTWLPVLVALSIVAFTIMGGIAVGLVLTHHSKPRVPTADAPKTSPTQAVSALSSPTAAPPVHPHAADATAVVPEPNTPATGTLAGTSPVDVAYNYYDAINAKNWARVWALGGDNLGETYSMMVSGYAHTANDIPYISGLSGDNVNLLLLAYEDNGDAQVYSSSLLIERGAIVSARQTLALTSNGDAFSALAGDWYVHDGFLQITEGGLGIMSYRTFNNCSTIADGCDRFTGNDIINGGLTIFRLTGGQGDEADGRILSSTTGPTGPISLTEHPNTDTLKFSDGSVFCGATSPQDKCGA